MHDQNRSTMHAQAYWVRGRAMGKKLDVPSEEQPSSESQVTTSNPRFSAASEPDGASSSLHSSHRNTDLSPGHSQKQFEDVGSSMPNVKSISQPGNSAALEVKHPASFPKARVVLVACGIVSAFIATLLLLHHKVH